MAKYWALEQVLAHLAVTDYRPRVLQDPSQSKTAGRGLNPINIGKSCFSDSPKSIITCITTTD